MNSSPASAASSRPRWGWRAPGCRPRPPWRGSDPRRACRSPRPGRPPAARPSSRPAADPAATAMQLDPPAVARRAPGVGGAGGGGGEHGTAGAVEVARQHVEHVDQPRRQRAELGRGGADASVDAGRRRIRQFVRQPTDLLGVQPGRLRHRLRRERLGQPDDLVDPGDIGLEAVETDQPVGGQHVDQRHEQEGSVPGRMARCRLDLRRLGPAGIHDDQPPTLFEQRLDAPRPVGGGRQAAVGGVGVGAQHQQEVGAVDVGHRHREHAAEHEANGDLLGSLVDRAGGEDVGGAEGPDEWPQEDQRGQGVGVGVAEVDADGVAAAARRSAAAGARPRRTPRPSSPARTGRLA